MPALLLSEKSVTVLKELVSDHGDDLELEEIRFQLSESLRPEQEGALYPQGTVVSHQSLAQVARWAANKEDKLRKELELCRLVRGAQIAIAMKPKPVRVRIALLLVLRNSSNEFTHSKLSFSHPN